MKEKCVVLLATACYAGYVPRVPGTAGTVVGIPLCYLLSRLGPMQATVFVFLFIGLAVWVSGEAEKLLKRKDSRQIVIDEMAGLSVTLFLIPWAVTNVVIGFLLFRLIDIVKPFPIRRLESTLSGGWGVVGDDVLAGMYAHIVLRIILRVF